MVVQGVRCLSAKLQCCQGTSLILPALWGSRRASWKLRLVQIYGTLAIGLPPLPVSLGPDSSVSAFCPGAGLSLPGAGGGGIVAMLAGAASHKMAAKV